jgi:hypothetical protein
VKRRALALPLLAALLLVGTALRPAGADDKWQQSNAKWKLADKCARLAAAKYPDYTPESLAKREAMRRNCLRASNIPVADGPGPAPR